MLFKLDEHNKTSVNMFQKENRLGSFPVLLEYNKQSSVKDIIRRSQLKEKTEEICFVNSQFMYFNCSGPFLQSVISNTTCINSVSVQGCIQYFGASCVPVYIREKRGMIPHIKSKLNIHIICLFCFLIDIVRKW